MTETNEFSFFSESSLGNLGRVPGALPGTRPAFFPYRNKPLTFESLKLG
jgi:hypothetical protein